MDVTLADVIRVAGAGQLCVLVASALVPVQLRWKQELAPLPRLVRQLFWTYGGYVVLGIVSLGVISLLCANELAGGSRLARAVCGYGAAVWGVRLCLQVVFDVRPHLTAWWLTTGYHILTILFVFISSVYLYAMVR